MMAPVTCRNFKTLFSFYIILSLPDDGRNYRPKHVVVKVINEYKIMRGVALIAKKK